MGPPHAATGRQGVGVTDNLKAAAVGSLIRLARGIYRATPFRPVREAYFQAFLHTVRGRRVVRTVEGMTFDLDLGELIDVGVFLEQFERDIVTLIERLTPAGAVVFDIGANVGAHTLRFAKLVGPSGRVFAFEPTDYAYGKLEKNLSLNAFPQVEALQLALSDHAAARQTVGFRSSWRSDRRQMPSTSIVDFVTLDDWCRHRGIAHVDVVKLDVDGHEYPVLAGGHQILQRSRPAILVETGAWHFAEERRNPLALLRDLGYRFWDTRTLVEFPDLDAIRRRLPERDDRMDLSINVLAMTKTPAGWNSRS